MMNDSSSLWHFHTYKILHNAITFVFHMYNKESERKCAELRELDYYPARACAARGKAIGLSVVCRLSLPLKSLVLDL